MSCSNVDNASQAPSFWAVGLALDSHVSSQVAVWPILPAGIDPDGAVEVQEAEVACTEFKPLR